MHKNFFVLVFSLFGLAAPAVAQTYDCTFKVPSRYQSWIPAQLQLDYDETHRRASVRAKLFDRFGARALKADIVFDNTARTKFVFWFHNSDVRRDRRAAQRANVGKTKYALTIYRDGRPVLFKAESAEAGYNVMEMSHRMKGTCLAR